MPESTPIPSEPSPSSHLVMLPHLNLSLSGSSTFSMQQKPTLESYLQEHKSLTIEDSLLMLRSKVYSVIALTGSNKKWFTIKALTL